MDKEANLKKVRSLKIYLFLFAVMLMAVLTGCGKLSAWLPSGSSSAEKDILTMQKPDEKKMTITIRAEYNVGNALIKTALEKQFPDVNFISVFHCSQITQYELRQSLLGGSAEDIIISPNMNQISDIAPDTMLDLSAESFTGNYNPLALENSQIKGKLYYLPGPSAMYGIVYDKTMFEEHGWQVPHSYDEFISLVKTINDSGIRAFQPTCKYARQAQLVFTMFDYDEVFGGAQNYKWLTDYQSGSASMKGHIEPALKRYKELNEAGIIKPEDFDMQPGNRSTMLYNDHTCAMIIENEQAVLYAKQAKSDHEYGMFPFWNGNNEDSDHIMTTPGYYIGISKKLADKGNEKKLAKVMEVLRYISTPEGQLAISGGKMTQISNVRGTSYEKNSFNTEVQSTIEKGNQVPEVNLMATGNNNPTEKQLQSDLRKFLEGSMDEEALMADCDGVRTKSLSVPLDRGKLAGTAEKTFTRTETGLFIADALKQKAGADIGLCLVGTVHCGMVGQIYKGDIYASDIESLSLSVGTVRKDDPNDKKLWLVSMTGAQLQDLLKYAYTYDPQDNVPNIPYYVASGLKIKFAPYAENKLVSVTMADGSALDAGKTYHVALWGWPFDNYPCPGSVEKVFEDKSNDLFSSAVSAQKTIKPFEDGRFQIVY